MSKRSAGILIYRRKLARIEVLLVHPGGPFWAKRDAGAWSIPKGLIDDGEDPEAAARRELLEETGWRVSGRLHPLGEIRQAGGKYVVGFAAKGDFDPGVLASNTITLEWPPRSGRKVTFPEVDRAAWLLLWQAETKIIPGQRPFLERLHAAIAGGEI